MTVQAAGGGYMDSVIIEVTVTAPTVTVTSPFNASVYQVGASINVSASASATDGSLSLSSVTISANGTSIGTIDYPLTEGEPTTFTWAVVGGANTFTATAVYGSGAEEVSVGSGAVTATGGSVTATGGNWEPSNAVVGEITYGDLTASAGGLDGDGSGQYFATYCWETATVPVTDPITSQTVDVLDLWESDDGGDTIPFALYNGNVAFGWPQNGFSMAEFSATFLDPGYYILVVKCIATAYDSNSGAAAGTVLGYGYEGGDASDLPAGSPTPNVMIAHAVNAHDGITGSKGKRIAQYYAYVEIMNGGYAHVAQGKHAEWGVDLSPGSPLPGAGVSRSVRDFTFGPLAGTHAYGPGQVKFIDCNPVLPGAAGNGGSFDEVFETPITEAQAKSMIAWGMKELGPPMNAGAPGRTPCPFGYFDVFGDNSRDFNCADFVLDGLASGGISTFGCDPFTLRRFSFFTPYSLRNWAVGDHAWIEIK